MKTKQITSKKGRKKQLSAKQKEPDCLCGKGIAGGKAVPPLTLKGLLRPVRSAKSAKRHLAKLLIALYRDEIEPIKARTAVYILSLFLHSIEVNDLESRIELLEKQGGDKCG